MARQSLEASCDSAGMYAYHVGEAPDPRSIATAANNSVEIAHLQARKITEQDFKTFDYLIAMDKGHQRAMYEMAPDLTSEKIFLLLDFHPDYRGMDVPDPYYGNRRDFKNTYSLIHSGLEHMTKTLFKEG